MERPEQRRRRANRLGAESRARPVARSCIEGNPDRRRVDALEIRHVRHTHERADSGEPRDYLRVDRPVRRPAHRRRLSAATCELGADDLDDPAAVALTVELEEEHALPGAETELAVAHRD